jgi:hypothetical protein
MCSSGLIKLKNIFKQLDTEIQVALCKFSKDLFHKFKSTLQSIVKNNNSRILLDKVLRASDLQKAALGEVSTVVEKGKVY